jgi:hypothetical protein
VVFHCEIRTKVENNVMRISGIKEEEFTGGCRKLHIEENRNLYSSPDRLLLEYGN